MARFTCTQLMVLAGLVFVVAIVILAQFPASGVRTVGFVALAMSFMAVGIVMPSIMPKHKNERNW